MGQRKSARPGLKKPQVAIVMGSKSDLAVMKEAYEILKEFKIPCEITVVSAHRTPDRLARFAKTASDRGLKVVIAGAGGSAHLPGMIASFATIPVIGVPIHSANSMMGLDSLLSIVQMPAGIPVATVAVNGAKNAGILAVMILSLSDRTLRDRVQKFKEDLRQKSHDAVQDMINEGYPNDFDQPKK